MTNRLLLLALSPLIMADAPPQALRTWWVEQTLSVDQSVEIDLVRARVRQVTTDGPLGIEITARGSQAGMVQIEVRQDERGVAVRDIYPAPSRAILPTECEPPAGDRGAYWRSDVMFDVLLNVPPGRKTHVRLMDDLGQTLAGPAKTARD